jgi:myo-inositol 2-dehydrogenase/D-chiro-inositol 1-dehydrogenase
VRAGGALTAVGYHWRHLDLVAEASALLRDRPAHLALGHWLDKTPAVQWWSIRAQSGGQLIEQTTHLFDLARLLVGEVSEVRAVEVTRAGEQSDGADVPTASSATLIFASGAIGTISSSCVLDGRARVGLQIVAEGMTVELSERSLVDHELRVNRGGADTVEVSGQDPIESEDREFVDALLGRILKVTVPYDEALRSHALVCAADQSARDGLPVSLDQLHAEARTDA